MSKNTDWHLEKWRKWAIFVSYKKPFIFTLSMKQIHALTAEQKHYKEVMSLFEAGMQYFLLKKDNKQ